MTARSRDVLANNYFELENTVALVTGASSGLGSHFAHVLAQAGCTVAIAARRKDRLQVLAKRIQDAGGKVLVVRMDVTDIQSVESGLDLVTEQTGTITVLVNNAGTADGNHFINADRDATQSVFNINQHAVWQVAQSFCKRLIAADVGGSVINIASVAGLRPLAGAASYSVSKAAVVQLTKVMALELARYSIRVNALAPGYIATEMNTEFLQSSKGQELIRRSPMRRIGEYQELDAALLLLASTKGSFITGATLPVDGGHLVASL